jgi:hypothetical protein
MKFSYVILITYVFCGTSVALTLEGLNQGHRFDASVYGSFETVGKNVQAQTDLSIGYSFCKYGMLSLATNVKYRNYFLTTSEYVFIGVGGSIRKNEGRIGAIGGCQTYLLSGYSKVIPVIGGELLYARFISDHISLRIKERITILAAEVRTLSTCTFFGFGVSF